MTRLHIPELHYIYAIVTSLLPQENDAMASAHICFNQGQIFSPVLLFFASVLTVLVGRDSAVGMATRYGLDGSGI